MAESKQIFRFSILEVMHQAECEHNIKCAELVNSMLADAFAQEFPAVGIASHSSGDIGLVCIHAQIIALGKKRNHVSRPATNVKYAIPGLWTNIVLNQYSTTEICTYDRVIEFVEKRMVKYIAGVFQHGPIAFRELSAVVYCFS